MARNNYKKQKGNHQQRGRSGKPQQRPYVSPSSKEEASALMDQSAVKERDAHRPGHNDAQWVIKNPKQAEAAANLGFGYTVGNNFKMYEGSASNHAEIGNAVTAIPGIMTFDVVIGIGKSTSPSDPANIAATNIYAYIRSKISGARSYSAPDVMMYLLILDVGYAMYNEMQKLYGCVMTYDVQNRYLPKALVTAMGYDFDDIQNNLANFKYFIRDFRNKLLSFPTPNDISLFTIHSWLFSNVYKDSDSPTSQIYVLRPKVFYTFEETLSDTGGMLVPFQYINDVQGLKFIDIKQAANNIINSLFNSSSLDIIKADIIKAYDGRFFSLSEMDDSYRIYPTYNAQFNAKIENATIMTTYAAFGAGKSSPVTYNDQLSGCIYQDPNSNLILYNPTFFSNVMGKNIQQVLNFHWNNPDYKDIMEATYFTVNYDEYAAIKIPGITDNQQIYKPTSAPTQIIVGAAIHYFNYKLQPANQLSRDTFEQVLYDYNNTGEAQLLRVSGSLSSFDWHPRVVLGTYTPGTTKILVSQLYDFDVYAPLPSETLKNIHETAIMSEFNVPNFG